MPNAPFDLRLTEPQLLQCNLSATVLGQGRMRDANTQRGARNAAHVPTAQRPVAALLPCSAVHVVPPIDGISLTRSVTDDSSKGTMVGHCVVDSVPQLQQQTVFECVNDVVEFVTTRGAV